MQKRAIINITVKLNTKSGVSRAQTQINGLSKNGGLLWNGLNA